MDGKKKSVLVVGFNTRPLAYSLNKAGYDVYVVDFFGDLDLYPYVKDYIIITKELNARYNSIKNKYQQFLAHYTINLLDRYPDIENLIIASGMDDYLEERKSILDEIKKKRYATKNLNNNINVIKNARNILKIHHTLKEMGYKKEQINQINMARHGVGAMGHKFGEGLGLNELVGQVAPMLNPGGGEMGEGMDIKSMIMSMLMSKFLPQQPGGQAPPSKQQGEYKI